MRALDMLALLLLIDVWLHTVAPYVRCVRSRYQNSVRVPGLTTTTNTVAQLVPAAFALLFLLFLIIKYLYSLYQVFIH